MTTATKASTESKADQLAALQKAKERLDEARRERAVRDEDARAFSRSVVQAQAELDRLARTEPEQFDDAGQPKPRTAAAKLKRKIDDSKTSRWPAVMAGLDDRIAECEAEVRRLIRPLAVELARAEYERGREAIREARICRDRIREALGKVHAPEPALLEIVAAAAGALDGRSVLVDERWREFERMLDALDEFEPARVAALTPYADEDPVIRRTADDSWMDVHYEPKAGWADEQPEPVERPS